MIGLRNLLDLSKLPLECGWHIIIQGECEIKGMLSCSQVGVIRVWPTHNINVIVNQFLQVGVHHGFSFLQVKNGYNGRVLMEQIKVKYHLITLLSPVPVVSLSVHLTLASPLSVTLIPEK